MSEAVIVAARCTTIGTSRTGTPGDGMGTALVPEVAR